jgi:hypothetical protein
MENYDFRREGENSVKTYPTSRLLLLFSVVRGLDNGIYYRMYDLQGKSWVVNWTRMGGATNLPIAATSNSDHIDFIVIGTDSAIYRYYQTI